MLIFLLGARAESQETLSGLRSADLLAAPTCGPGTVREIRLWLAEQGIELDKPPGDAALVAAAYNAIREARLPKLSIRDRDRLMIEIVRLVHRRESR